MPVTSPRANEWRVGEGRALVGSTPGGWPEMTAMSPVAAFLARLLCYYCALSDGAGSLSGAHFVRRSVDQ